MVIDAEEKFKVAREVYYHRSFSDCFDNLAKERTGLYSEYIKKLTNTVDDLLTITRLKSFLIKERYMRKSRGTEHDIYKFRLTDGEHGGTGISRIYYCEAGEVPSLISNNDKYHKSDIVLLWFTFDDKDHDGFQEFFKSLDKAIPVMSEVDVKRIDDLPIIDLPSKYLHRGDIEILDAGDYSSLPRLSREQRGQLEFCINHPPCVVHGPAGSGKTLLSEMLYAKFTKDGMRCLYVTYMKRLKLQVEEDLSAVWDLDSPECLTMDDLTEMFLPEYCRAGKYWGESDFRKWVNKQLDGYNKNKNNDMRKILGKISSDEDLATSIAYLFFRTYSDKENYRSFNDDPRARDDEKAEDRFIRLCKSEEGIDLEKKKNVFKICQMYEAYLKSEDIINDNEAARKIKGMKEHASGKAEEDRMPDYDVIIVDEVQDLTEPQIDCLTSLLNKGLEKKFFYVFGDDNQTINPTLMGVRNVRTKLTNNLKVVAGFPEDMDDKVKPLGTTFRNSVYMVNYINYINGIRKNSIAAGKAYDEQKLEPVGEIKRNESDYPVYLLDADTCGLSDICLGMSDIMITNEVVIITADSKTKTKLLERHPYLNVEDADYVCTIEDTKGREWDHVILYDFFTSAESVWVDITINDEEKRSGKKGLGNRSSIYRRYFNRYYVGLTRARRKVIIMETGNLDPKIIDDFFPKYKDRDGISLEQLKDSNTYRSYFDYDHTHDIWDSEAKKLFDRGDFEEALTRQHKAMDALDKGMNPEDAAPIRESYARKCDVYTAYEHVSRRDVSPEDAQKYLRVFLDGMTDDADRSIDFLARLYDATGDERKASLVRTDPWNDFSQYLEQFDRVKDTFEDNEKGFFYSNAIVAYERKISSIKKGV